MDYLENTTKKNYPFLNKLEPYAIDYIHGKITWDDVYNAAKNIIYKDVVKEMKKRLKERGEI